MEQRATRRHVLATLGVSIGAAASPLPASGGQRWIDEWLDTTDNYDGTVRDLRGQDTVTIAVGAAGNGGAFAFDPPAVWVDPGTTLRWEWTGEGGTHNVVSPDEGPLDSGRTTDERGVNYEYTVENAGQYRYRCLPHESLGMKGVVAVGESRQGPGIETRTAVPTQTRTVTDRSAATPATQSGGDGGVGGDTEQETTGPATRSRTETVTTQSRTETATPTATEPGTTTDETGPGFTAVAVGAGVLGALGLDRLREWSRERPNGP